MDSIDLFDERKTKIEYNKNHIIKTNTNKFSNYVKFIDLKLIILLSILISNLYIVYLFRSMNNFKSLFPKSFISENSEKVDKAENIINKSFLIQKDFCENPNKYVNNQYENMINLTDFKFKDIDYKLYVYKEGDNHISNSIIRKKGYDAKEMNNFYDVLEYYQKKNNIFDKKDIYMLDLGANLGVYPSYFGKLGYTVISFEASPRNYYLLKKNYCLINRNSQNIILINRGISNKEKICNYYTQITGLGNGMVKCDENREEFDNAGFHWKKTFEVPIIKLSDFIPYLVSKNLALIKLDIEGSEALVMQEALELITKYHVPYIYSEFNMAMITEHGNNPREYIKLFTDNGYKVSREGFLSKNFISPDKVFSVEVLYFTYYGSE